MPDYRSSPAVGLFVREAREYCVFVEAAGNLALPVRLRSAQRRLLELYAAGTALPSIEPAGDTNKTSPAPPKDWAGFERFDAYWEVFDPYELEDPVGASLSDDMLDVYGDLRRGLALWDEGAEQSAIWEWRFSFETHWGDHAIDALRALHRACVRS